MSETAFVAFPSPAARLVAPVNVQTPTAVTPAATQVPGSTGRAGVLGALGVSVAVVRAAVVGGSRRTKRNLRSQRAAVALKATDTVELVERTDIRNLAIIAHVDHGKTTMTDKLMQQCGNIDHHLDDKAKLATMDSNELESERGITILAKNAALRYKGVKVNLIDTPGHADFGGEVERILNMADGCLLLVDAQEGPMPQTKFVLRKAVELKKKVIVCINKVDKPGSRADWVMDATFDLFSALGADDETCDFPCCYASGVNGVASAEGPDSLAKDLSPLLDMILAECPMPKVDEKQDLQMLVANLDYNDYVGRICIGRITSGSIKVGQTVGFVYGEEGEVRKCKIGKLWQFKDNDKEEVAEVTAGDICAFTGMDDCTIGDTVCNPDNPLPLPPILVEEPTVVMEFGVNTSPFAGQEKLSTKVTGGEIDKRLKKETMTNLALRVSPGKNSESFKVKGRGTLQLGVLMENMRREGFEIMVGAPQVIYRQDPESGAKQEPYEEAVIEVPTEMQGAVMEEFQKKGAMMKTMEAGSMENSMQMTFEIPTANLIGMQGTLLSRCRGMAVMNSVFSHWGDVQVGEVKIRDKGSIVNIGAGKASTYSLMNIGARGECFIMPGDEVYDGMCIGIHNKENDMTCNITKEKAVNNTRAGGMGGPSVSKANAAKNMSIDDFLGHMEMDEMLEVTPGPLRLCKKNAKGLRARK